MISLNGIGKSFGSLRAIDGVSLDVAAGSTTALLGPSGCGKSTLLRVILGLVWPDRGEVRFDHQAVEPGSVRAVRRRIGYAIQSGGLFPHMTARENVALPARHARWPAHELHERIGELTDLVHLSTDQLNRFPGELSGGQRQRVALMRALLLRPDALLLDEPLGALDPVIRASLQSDLREMFDRLRTTVVLVTHDIAEAAFLAPDDIVLMDHGRIAQRGSFAELRSSPESEFVRTFVSEQVGRVRSLLGAGA